MKDAGINTETFKAHSTRSASTTAATVKGLSFEEIQKCANWTNKSTFQKFYYRPRHSSAFSSAVLSHHTGKLVIY